MTDLLNQRLNNLEATVENTIYGAEPPEPHQAIFLLGSAMGLARQYREECDELRRRQRLMRDVITHGKDVLNDAGSEQFWGDSLSGLQQAILDYEAALR